MLTAGDIVNAVCRFYVGVSDDDGNQKLRNRTLWFAQEGAERLWTFAPVWWRESSGNSVSVTGNQTYGTMPSDFAHMGTQGNLYIAGQPDRPPLIYKPPDILRDLLQRTTQTVSFPEYFTLEGRSTAGIPKARVALTPGSTITLTATGYVRKSPLLVDCPGTPTAASSGSTGNLTGAYRWRMTFVTALGETEGGAVTPALTVSAKSVSLTNLPMPPDWLLGTVTGKKLYRTAASGLEYKLVDTMSSIYTASYTDNIADVGLGATCPTPATAVGTGLEQFPEDWQRSLVFRYAEASAAQKQGDVRDRSWYEDWTGEVRRMWAELQQGQNVPNVMPRYGQRRALGQYRSYRERLTS